MLIKTRKLPATQSEGERMRATADNGATLTIPFPYGAADPHQLVADALVMAYGDTHRAEHATGHTYNVVRKEES